MEGQDSRYRKRINKDLKKGGQKKRSIQVSGQEKEGTRLTGVKSRAWGVVRGYNNYPFMGKETSFRKIGPSGSPKVPRKTKRGKGRSKHQREWASKRHQLLNRLPLKWGPVEKALPPGIPPGERGKGIRGRMEILS